MKVINLLRTLNAETSGHAIDINNPFAEIAGKKGEIHQFEDTENNFISFMISGSIKVTDCRGNVTIMKADHMYAFNYLSAPYRAEPLDNFHALVLLTHSLSNHVNAANIKKMLTIEHAPTGVRELPYNEVMKQYIHNLLLLKGIGHISNDLYTIKKIEFVHYMRRLYSTEELSAFLSGILSTYGKFRFNVYQNYNNAISVEQLAESLHMTTKTLCRTFRKEFNKTPQEWLLDQKAYNLNHAIMNRGLQLPQILEEFDFPTNSALKQFCKRNALDHLLPMLPPSKND